MPNSNTQFEKQTLKFSAALALSFAVLGIVFGWFVGSIVIIFDGAYSLVSLLLTLLSLGVSTYIAQPSSRKFPFGKAMLEPMVIAVKALVILSLVMISLYSALTSLLQGGRDVDAGAAFLFGVINVIGCALSWWFVAKKAKLTSSGLIEAETKQWKMDTLISLAVALGFIVSLVLTQTRFVQYAGYADPIMMLLMGFYFIKVPTEMLTQAFRELLMMAPKKEVIQKVQQEVILINQDLDSKIQVAAVTKVGQELCVKINVHTEDNILDITELKHTKSRLNERLSPLTNDLNLIINVAC